MRTLCIFAISAALAVGCATSPTDPPPRRALAGLRLPASAAMKPYPPGPSVAACGFCGDVAGKNDLPQIAVTMRRHARSLCEQSFFATCKAGGTACASDTECCSLRCQGGACTAAQNGVCAVECGQDWCARLGDVAYSNASAACNDCAVAKAWPEISSCSSAQ